METKTWLETENRPAFTVGIANGVGLRMVSIKMHGRSEVGGQRSEGGGQRSEARRPLMMMASRLTAARVAERIAVIYGVSPHEILDGGRPARLVEARQVALYLFWIITGATLGEAARKFGRRDHGTAGWAVRRVENWCATDAEFAERIRKLRISLTTEAQNWAHYD